MIQVLDDMKRCCGCGACFNICHAGAIEMVENAEGFLEPSIDADACIDCGLCQNVCPILNADYSNDSEPSVFAFAMGDDVLYDSSSGGAFTALVQETLDRGGIVYGAAYDGHWNVKHIAIESMDGLDALRRSKYLQSDQGRCYSDVKSQLSAGRLVLYSGCPCQIAGLKGFLRKDHDNLITADLICHGIPSPGLFHRYLEETFGFENIEEIEMRLRDGWATCFYATLKDGSLYRRRGKKDAYIRAFLDDLALRTSCYGCPFAKTPRQGDITLGDLWCVKKIGLQDEFGKKSSIVLANNAKGRSFFDETVSHLPENSGARCKEIDFATNKKKLNRNIFKPSIPRIPERRKQFFDLLETGTILESVMKTSHGYDVGLLLYMSDNYGSTATNYALYRAVEQLGYRPIILNTLVEPRGISLTFSQEHLALSSKIISKRDFSYANALCDSFILGSDQSLNWDYKIVQRGMEYLLMGFTGDAKRRIAYASSFGPYKTTIDPGLQKVYANLLGRFTSVSVREDYAVDMARNLFRVSASHVPDPVFLINADDYRAIAREHDAAENPYLFAYILDASQEKRDFVRKTASDLGLRLVVSCDATKFEERRRALAMQEALDKQEFVDWLGLLINASFVITDSFHGTCLSLIMQKRHIAIKARGKGRFDSLARSFAKNPDISLPIYDSVKDANAFGIPDELDWKAVENVIADLRTNGLQWLADALSAPLPEGNSGANKAFVDYVRAYRGGAKAMSALADYSYLEFKREQSKLEEALAKGSNYVDTRRALCNLPTHAIRKDFGTITDARKLFDTLRKNPDYVLLASGKDECSKHWDALAKASKGLLKKKPGYRESYLFAVRGSSTLFEIVSPDGVWKHFTLSHSSFSMASSRKKADDGPIHLPPYSVVPSVISLFSSGFNGTEHSETSKILVNNVDYSLNKSGLNIVILDVTTGTVVDSANIDLSGDPKIKLKRQ